jgi:hypothetical protein
MTNNHYYEREDKMTIESKLTKMLIDRGMFPEQAAEVIAAVKADKANEEISIRFSDDEEGYPLQLMAAMWETTRQHALEWIDANLPRAWFRPLFLLDGDK